METLMMRLLEAGFNDQAVAVCGMSLERFKTTVSTGTVPWAHPGIGMSPYQAELVAGGRYLYYALPLIERIDLYNRTLANAVKRKSEGKGLEVEDILGSATSYADGMEIRTSFFRETGIYEYEWNILYTASILDPVKFNLRLANPELRIDYILAEEFGTSLIDKHPGLQDRPDVMSAIVACMDKRGVLVFLNGAIFDHKVRPGVETDNEIMIVSDNPLRASVLSGAKLLTI